MFSKSLQSLCISWIVIGSIVCRLDAEPEIEPETKIETKTLAFFDLETTGLFGANNKAPQITEFALVAIQRNEFLQAINRVEKVINPSASSGKHSGGEKYFINPRITNKLVQVLQPDIPISSKAIEISGITHSSLADMPSFPTFAPTIRSFLNNLPKPITLIAHNAYQFDCKLLNAELARTTNTSLGDEIFCADTRYLIKDIDARWRKETVQPRDEKRAKKPLIERTKKVISQLNQGAVKSYSLETIHTRLFAGTKPRGHHSAESNCLSLMQICAQYGKEFLDELDAKKTLLEKVTNGFRTDNENDDSPNSADNDKTKPKKTTMKEKITDENVDTNTESTK